MMEEQAEYDQEAIQVMKELLDKRDEGVGLESELEVYRDRYGVVELGLRGVDEFEEEEGGGDVELEYEVSAGGGNESTAALIREVSDISQRLQAFE